MRVKGTLTFDPKRKHHRLRAFIVQETSIYTIRRYVIEFCCHHEKIGQRGLSLKGIRKYRFPQLSHYFHYHFETGKNLPINNTFLKIFKKSYIVVTQDKQLRLSFHEKLILLHSAQECDELIK